MRLKLVLLILTASAGANSGATDDRFHLFRPCEEIMKTAEAANFALSSGVEFQVPAREKSTDMVTYPTNPDAVRGRLSTDANVLYVSKLENMLPKNLDPKVRNFFDSANSSKALEAVAEFVTRYSWMRDMLPNLSASQWYEYLLVSQYPNARDRLNVEMLVYLRSQGRPSRSFYRTSAFTFEVLEKHVVVSLNVLNPQNGPYPVRTNKAYWIMDETWPKFKHYAEHKMGAIYFPIENFPEFIATIRDLGWDFY